MTPNGSANIFGTLGNPMNAYGYCAVEQKVGFNIPKDTQGKCILTGENTGSHSALSEIEVWKITPLA
jgi:hypothetical protein